MKISEMLSSQVICLAEAKPLGVIITAIADNKLKRIKGVVIADSDDNEGYLSMRYLKKGEVYYTLYKTPELEQVGINIPFQKDIYNTDGVYIGRLLDIEIEGESITNLLTSDGKSIPANTIVVASGDLVIVKGNNKLRIPRNKSTHGNSSKVDIENSFNNYTPSAVDSKVENEGVISVLEHKAEAPITSRGGAESVKMISSYAFLLGRRVIKRVIHNGSTLIPEGRIIDIDTVELARNNGKLVELTVSSKE